MAETFWHLENVRGECPKPNSDDALTHQRLRDAVTIKEEGRYEVPLIFKTPNGEPPCNAELPQMKGLAVGRLESQMRSLRNKPKLLKECTAQVQGMLERGEVEVIPRDAQYYSLPEALEKYKISKQKCADPQMNLREYASNSAECNSGIPAEDRATLTRALPCRHLDHSLDPKEDPEPLLSPGLTPHTAPEQAPKPRAGAADGPLTRLKTLLLIARVFDPCELVSPVLVASKLVLQQIWKLKHGCDQASGASTDDLVA
ncbi:hypothetical protein AAVH_25550 [Aphelenchoides avenae]|nr:hypothetical protein AAVH_25550 [Aphelenchus avenae]